MKFSCCVAEFNPFHNGHKYLIEQMKRKGDVVAVVMGGDFCQRGETAVLDKYTRARHAVLAGADIVFELPAVFATAPAEIFAKGAIKLLSAINGEKTLFFGTEKGKKQDFLNLAAALMDETKEFKAALKERLKLGEPFALARYNALKETSGGLDISLLDAPNSILGVEYVKAIKFFRSDMDFEPIERQVGHGDKTLKGTICSAQAIREAIEQGKRAKIKKFVPKYTYKDLPSTLPAADKLALFALLETAAKDLKETTDCTEGLENRLKAFAQNSYSIEELVNKTETRRYTRSRLCRIITANMLGITDAFTEKCLKNKLYLKVLAVARDKKDVLAALAGADVPLLTRKADVVALGGVATACFEKDCFANSVYSLITETPTNEYQMKIVER